MSEEELITFSLSDHVATLVSRIPEAIFVESKKIEIGGQAPLENRCHDNVVKLCEADSSYIQVYGYLFSDFSAVGYLLFIFHSVVRNESGNLYDITPSSAHNRYKFIESGIPDDIYRELMYQYAPALRINI